MGQVTGRSQSRKRGPGKGRLRQTNLPAVVEHPQAGGISFRKRNHVIVIGLRSSTRCNAPRPPPYSPWGLSAFRPLPRPLEHHPPMPVPASHPPLPPLQFMQFTVGDRVEFTLPSWRGMPRGTITDIFRITPAVGHDRIKLVVTCHHPKTKSKTGSYAAEPIDLRRI